MKNICTLRNKFHSLKRIINFLFIGIVSGLSITPTFGQDTIYLDRKGTWTKDHTEAKQYCFQEQASDGNIKVTFYNMGDTLLRVQHFASFTSLPKKRIANGLATIYYPNGQISREYCFKNGKLDGEYRIYYEDGKSKYIGNYTKGRLDGKITMYHHNGKLWRTETYKSGKSKGGHVYDETGKEIDFYPSERMPQFPGGTNKLTWIISQNLKYPKEAQNNGIEGRVLAEFIVDKTGKVSRYRILPKSIDYHPFRAEAIRVIEDVLLPIQWEPGIQFGDYVRTRYTIPFNFRLNKKKN